MKRHKRKPGTENSAMTPAGTAIQRKAQVGSVMQIPNTTLIQRKAAAHSPGDYDDEHVRLKPSNGQAKPFAQANGDGAAGDAVSNKIETTRGGGSPMADSTKSFMENRFGNDFSDVKIHTGDYAAQISNDLNAQAFTVGRDIYFNSGKYAPGTSDGKRLLAHELAHVVQQNNNGLSVQRAKIEGTRSTSSDFNLNSNTQKQESDDRNSGFQAVKLTYDSDYDMFLVTFLMLWLFPAKWSDSQRNGYAYDFEDAVRKVWDNKFRLQEKNGDKRSASVSILFDNDIIHHDDDSAVEFSKITKQRSPWIMDVSSATDRSNVDRPFVHLEEDATKDKKRKGADVRAGTGFSVNDGNDNKTFTQNTAAHEFGHMIGLGDEYINDSGTSAKQIDPARAHINDRIMNIGSTVTPDVYAPFADWLSGLTGTKWVVGSKVQ